MWLTDITISLFSTEMSTCEEGLAAYKAGQYGKALAKLWPYAKKGNALAQLTLGTIYKNGLCVSKDVETAAEWYRKAAIPADPDAQL